MRTGSEPDIWEAIEDIKAFATVDPNRCISPGIHGEATTRGQLPNVRPIYGITVAYQR